jgi:hypothetical protein
MCETCSFTLTRLFFVCNFQLMDVKILIVAKISIPCVKEFLFVERCYYVRRLITMLCL